MRRPKRLRDKRNQRREIPQCLLVSRSLLSLLLHSSPPFMDTALRSSIDSNDHHRIAFSWKRVSRGEKRREIHCTLDERGSERRRSWRKTVTPFSPSNVGWPLSAISFSYSHPSHVQNDSNVSSSLCVCPSCLPFLSRRERWSTSSSFHSGRNDYPPSRFLLFCSVLFCSVLYRTVLFSSTSPLETRISPSHLFPLERLSIILLHPLSPSVASRFYMSCRTSFQNSHVLSVNELVSVTPEGF